MVAILCGAVVVPRSVQAQEIGAGYEVAWLNGNNMTDLHGPRVFVRRSHVVFTVDLSSGSETGQGIPCGGFILPGSGCDEQPVVRDATVVRGTVGYVFGRGWRDWRLEIVPRLGLGRVKGTTRGLVSGRSLHGSQAVLEFGLQGGLKRRIGGLPLWMGAAAHIGRSRAVLVESCQDCALPYRSGYSTGGLSLFASYVLN